jgi:2-oxoglutarate/2-oxoacid ferredoxin oxidoreductase subunit alpha
MEKRLRKFETLKKELPEPKYFGPENPKRVFVGWGSTKHMILDVLNEGNHSDIGYIHYECIYPLKTDILEKLSQNGVDLIVIEQNATSQLAKLINSVKPDIKIAGTKCKYDGRPFFYEEVIDQLDSLSYRA